MNPILNAALSYASRNIPVFPCGPDKRPLTARGFYAATCNSEQITSWFDRTEPPLIGIPTGETSGMWVLDIDRKNGVDGSDALDTLETEHGKLPETTVSLTAGGGEHRVWQYTGQVRCSTSKLGPGLDVRGDGGYFIAPPSRVNGSSYEWEGSSIKPQPAPDWLAKMVAPVQRRYSRDQREPTESDVRRARAALFSISLGEDVGRDQWLEIGMAYRAEGGEYDVFDQWCQSQPNYNAENVEKEWASFSEDGGISGATLYYYAKLHGWRDGPQIRFSSSAAKVEPMELEEKLDKEGKPLGFVPSLANVVELLSKHERWAGRIVLNEISGRIELVNGVRSYESTDAAVHEIRTWMDTVHKWTAKPSRQHVFDALEVVAGRQSYDPVYDYLTGLQWDGVERLPFWLDDVCGVAKTEYTMAVAAKMLIGAVARVFEPGCKLDTMVVFVGPQGAMKSTMVGELSKPWHVDTPILLGNKDAYQALTGAWCYEFAELASFSGKAVEKLKAFFSSGHDTYRPSYGRTVVSVPRRNWFCATTNDAEFLHDATGARRFWIIEISHVDIELLKAHRDQLWAEAVQLYRAGEVWHMEGEAAEQQEHAAEQHYTVDPWEGLISDYLTGKDRTTAGDVLASLGVEVQNRTKADAMRVTRIVRDRLGWVRQAVWIDGKTVKGYRRQMRRVRG